MEICYAGLAAALPVCLAQGDSNEIHMSVYKKTAPTLCRQGGALMQWQQEKLSRVVWER